MRRVALLTAVISLGLAAPAAAWVELPPYPIPHDRVAVCLRAAGPGQLALLGHLGRRTSATDLLTVGPSRIARRSSTTLGWLDSCAEVGVAPGVSPLLVAPVTHKRRNNSLRVADAGATPATLVPNASLESPPLVAVAPNGAAVVVWTQSATDDASRLLAAVRPAAHAPFGPPTTLGEIPKESSVEPVAGINAAGRATVVWVNNESRRGASLLRVASTTDGGRFGASQPLASASGEQLALAVSPGGRVLVVAYGGFGGLAAYEHAPGATAFAPVPVPLSQPPDDMAIAVADDGSAVIAYRSYGTAALALLRRPDGTFGHERLIDGRRSNNGSLSFGFEGFGGANGPRPTEPDDGRGGQMVAAVAPDGRLLVSWTATGDYSRAASARVASGTLRDGLAHAVRLGSPCRAANAARPLTLADGTLGAAWTDNASVDSEGDGDGYLDLPLAGGQLHVVAPTGAPSRAGAAPSVSARLIGPRALHGGQAIQLRVRCRRGPCVVRAVATTYDLDPTRRGGGSPQIASSVELPRGRSGLIQLAGSDGRSFARPRGAPATISLLACPVTGPGVTRLALHERLRRLPPRPLPRILDLAAHRHGNSIRVTWRISAPARDVSFELTPEPGDTSESFGGSGRSRFAITLQGSRSARTVAVVASNSDQSAQEPTRTRIR